MHQAERTYGQDSKELHGATATFTVILNNLAAMWKEEVTFTTRLKNWMLSLLHGWVVKNIVMVLTCCGKGFRRNPSPVDD